MMWARLFRSLTLLGAIVTMALVLPTLSPHDLVAPGGLATAIGRLTGMLGTYLLLVTVLLVGRIPSVERALGQDTLVRWHRRLGPWVIILLRRPRPVHHPGLRAGRQDRPAARARHARHALPRHARRGRRPRADRRWPA